MSLYSHILENEISSNPSDWHLISSCYQKDKSKEIALFIRKRIKDAGMSNELVLADPISSNNGSISSPIIFGQNSKIARDPEQVGSFITKLGLKPKKIANIRILVVVIFPVGDEFTDKFILYYLNRRVDKWYYKVYDIDNWKIAIQAYISEPYMSYLPAPSLESQQLLCSVSNEPSRNTSENIPKIYEYPVVDEKEDLLKRINDLERRICKFENLHNNFKELNNVGGKKFDTHSPNSLVNSPINCSGLSTSSSPSMDTNMDVASEVHNYYTNITPYSTPLKIKI